MTEKESKIVQNLDSSVYINTYLTSMFVQVCTLFQGMILARMLGPEGRGEFAAIQLWPSVFATLGLMGINMAIARRAGKNTDYGLLTRTATLISFLTGIITVSICYFFVPFLIPEQNFNLIPYTFLFLLFIPINHMAINFLAIDQGKGDFKLLNITRSILYPVFFAGLVYTWFFVEDRLLGCVIALLASNAVVVIFRFGIKWNKIHNNRDFLPLKEIFREGFPFQLSAVFTLASQYVDQVLLLWILNPRELGIYLIAFSSASVIGSLPSSLGIISLSKATQLDKKYGFSPLAQLIRRGGIVVFFAAIVFAPLLHLLIPLVYGVEFEAAIPLAVILLFGVVAAGLANIIEQALRGHGMPLAGIRARIVGVLTLFFVGGIMAGNLGTIGVVLGYVIAQWIVLLMMLRVVFLIFRNSTLREVIPQLDDFLFIMRNLKSYSLKIFNIRY